MTTQKLFTIDPHTGNFTAFKPSDTVDSQNLPEMVGATHSLDGKKGVVSAPEAGPIRYFGSDGHWSLTWPYNPGITDTVGIGRDPTVIDVVNICGQFRVVKWMILIYTSGGKGASCEVSSFVKGSDVSVQQYAIQGDYIDYDLDCLADSTSVSLQIVSREDIMVRSVKISLFGT